MSSFNLSSICSDLCAAGSVDAKGAFGRAALNPTTPTMSCSMEHKP